MAENIEQLQKKEGYFTISSHLMIDEKGAYVYNRKRQLALNKSEC